MEQPTVEQLQQEIAKLKLERDEAVARAQKAEELNNKPHIHNIPYVKASHRLNTRIPLKTLLAEGKSRIGQEVLVAGWARTIRKQGGGRFCFVELNDGSIFTSLQVVVNEGTPGYDEVVGPNAGTGACFIFVGQVVESLGKGQVIELKATQSELHGKCIPGTYPLAKKGLPYEFLRSVAHLRARTNTFGAIARVRNACAMATHLFFQGQGFVYLHTPLITASDCEGAGEMFQVTTLLKNGGAKINEVPLLKDAQNKATDRVDYTQDFFGKPSFLTVSGQLNGEMYASALGKIYTFGPTFRAEVSHTPRHMAEFWMIEPEIAFADLEENMNIAEAYLKFVVQYVLEFCREDLEFFDKQVEQGLIARLHNVLGTPFKRLTYTEAVDLLLKVTDKQFEVKVEWGIDLKSEHERYITEQIFKQPVILTDYPKDIKAFYMKLNEDGKTVRAMDVLVPRIGEIIGGSQREERLEVLETRIKATGMDMEAYRHYLDLRRFGTCVHSGFGLGFERLIMFVTGMENIRDVIPFPRYPGHADF